MYPRTNRKKNGRQINENYIRGEEHADDIFNLNSSIGNQALIENLDDLLAAEDNLLPDNEQRSQDLITQRPVHRHKSSRTNNIIDENEDDSLSEDSDIKIVNPEVVRVKRYDEESDSEETVKPLKPKKPKKSTEKKAKKAVSGKRFADEINIMNSPPP